MIKKSGVIALLVQVICCVLPASAQSLHNGGFELWNSLSFNSPVHWHTSNTYSLSLADTPVTKIAGLNGQAIRLRSNMSGVPGSIQNTLGDPYSAEGGEPFNQQATGISIVKRHSIASGDTAKVCLYFKKSGLVIFDTVIDIVGSQSTFASTTYQFPGAFSTSPDSVVVVISATNPFVWGGGGTSTLDIDEITFTGSAQQLSNSGFNSWAVVTAEEPDGWFSPDSVSKTTDKYSGNYAAKLTSFDIGQGNINYAALGASFFSMPETFVLTGYYKYIPMGTDTAGIEIAMQGTVNGGLDSAIDILRYPLKAVSSYTPFSIALKSDTLEHISMLVMQFRSSMLDYPPVGSALYLDGLAINNTATGLSFAGVEGGGVSAYPNPASSILSIDLAKEGPGVITITNLGGQVLRSVKGIAKDYDIPIKDLPAGLYLYEVRQNGGYTSKLFMKL
jgi:hypothetical protein